MPNDPLYSTSQEALHPTLGISDANINVELAWDIYNFGGDPEIKVRYLDKLIDELAKGKKMESILRQ